MIVQYIQSIDWSDEYELNVIEQGTECSHLNAGSEKKIVLLDPIMFQSRLMAPIPGRNKSLFLPKVDSNADFDAYCKQNSKEAFCYPCYGVCSKQNFNAGATNRVNLLCHALQSRFIQEKIKHSKTDSDADSDVHDQNAGQQLLQKYYWIVLYTCQNDQRSI